MLGTRKQLIITEIAGIIKESYEQLHANNLDRRISQSVRRVDEVRVNGSQIRQALRQAEFQFHLEGNRAMAGIGARELL